MINNEPMTPGEHEFMVRVLVFAGMGRGEAERFIAEGLVRAATDRTAATINEMTRENVVDPCATLNCGHSFSREHKSLAGGGYGLCLVAGCHCENGLKP